MESVIGEYSSYQAALRAHNLEGHVIAVWANTHGTEKAAFSLLKGAWLRCRILLSPYLQWSWCHHLSRRPLQGKTKGRGWTCWGRTRRCRDCLCRKNTFVHHCHSHRLHNSQVCLFWAGRWGRNHTQLQRGCKNKGANKRPYKNHRRSDKSRHMRLIRGHKYDKLGERWSQLAMRGLNKRSRHVNIYYSQWSCAWCL